MRISDINKKEHALTISFGEDAELNVTYRASRTSFADMERITESALKMQKKLSDETSDIKSRLGSTESALIDPLLEMLVSWDLTEDDGETVIPITREGLRTVPFTILLEVTRAVQADQKPAGGKAR